MPRRKKTHKRNASSSQPSPSWPPLTTGVWARGSGSLPHSSKCRLQGSSPGPAPHSTRQVGLQLRLWGEGQPRRSGRKMGRSWPGIQKGSPPGDRPKSPVSCLAWRMDHRAWPIQATYNGEVIVIGLCLIPIPGIQRHRVHSKQHFGRRITLCQLFGGATACMWGEGCWVMIPNRLSSAFHPAQA